MFKYDILTYSSWLIEHYLIDLLAMLHFKKKRKKTVDLYYKVNSEIIAFLFLELYLMDS